MRRFGVTNVYTFVCCTGALKIEMMCCQRRGHLYALHVQYGRLRKCEPNSCQMVVNPQQHFDLSEDHVVTYTKHEQNGTHTYSTLHLRANNRLHALPSAASFFLSLTLVIPLPSTCFSLHRPNQSQPTPCRAHTRTYACTNAHTHTHTMTHTDTAECA